jgi:cell division protein ZapA
MLGRAIDAKLADMPHIASQSEARALLYAALLLADENYELSQNSGNAAPAPDVAEGLEALAGRLEDIASQLESAS